MALEMDKSHRYKVGSVAKIMAEIARGKKEGSVNILSEKYRLLGFPYEFSVKIILFRIARWRIGEKEPVCRSIWRFSYGK